MNPYSPVGLGRTDQSRADKGETKVFFNKGYTTTTTAPYDQYTRPLGEENKSLE
jgi:hypothetical protein